MEELDKARKDHRPPEPPPTNAKPDVQGALDRAFQYGGIDGGHHKMWVIDQMVRCLTGVKYVEWVKTAKAGEDGPETYTWDEGIPP
jgi:hypothetical protein